MDADFKELKNPVELKFSFNNISVLFDAEHGGLETMLVGLVSVPVEDFDRHIVTVWHAHPNRLLILIIPKTNKSPIDTNIPLTGRTRSLIRA
jgi:hypothetical protein